MADSKNKMLHKRSVEKGKVPSGSTLEYGEIAINYNAEAPFLSIKDSNNNYRKFIDETTIDEKLSDFLTTEITYDELVALRDGGELIPGMQYRITDYVTTTTQTKTQSAGHQFDVIVTADDESTLNEVARAIQHEGDTYFAENDVINAWQIWYCLDNDTDRFTWAYGQYSLIHEGNEYIRASQKDTVKNGKVYFAWTEYDEDITVYTLNKNPIRGEFVFDDTFVEDWEIYQILYYGKGVIYRMIDERGNDCPYDFKNIMFKHPNDTITYPDYYYTFSLIENGVVLDASLSRACVIFNNTILATRTNSISYELNNIVVCDEGSYINYANNSFGYDCSGNSFRGSCYGNRFGNDCCNNFVDNSCNYNSFGNGCSRNIINGSYNSFGNGCSRNIINGSYNSFGNGCIHNSFRKNASTTADMANGSYNHFDDGCSYNVIWNSDTSYIEHIKNINVNRGVCGTSSSYNYINIDTLNQDYEIEIVKTSDGIYIYSITEADDTEVHSVWNKIINE